MRIFLMIFVPTIRDRFALGGRLAIRRLCFAGCGNSCSSVTGRASPHPDPGGGRPHTPASYEIRGHDLTHPFQRRLPFSALRIPEAMLRGVREQLFFCYRESFPAPGSGGGSPHIPASYEIRAHDLNHPFQRRLPFSALRIPEAMLRGVRERLFICYRESFSAPGSRGRQPHTLASCRIRWLHMTYPFQRRLPFSALGIPESMLRRVRERLFICYRESFSAPGSLGRQPHTSLV